VFRTFARVGAEPRASPQGLLQIGRASVFLQKIAKGFIREFLKSHHAIAGKLIERSKIFRLEFDDLAFHDAGERRSGSRFGRSLLNTRTVT
jgi:hypothetical protein